MILCPDRVSLPGLLILTMVLATACSASLPDDRDGTFPPGSKTRYVNLARCTPAMPCPGPNCADNILGVEDNKTLDMAACPTLDLTWTGGTVLNLQSLPDISLHVARVAGITRVEASQDGVSYTIVGFLGGSPAGTPATCMAGTRPNEALIYLGKCNTITNVHHLRITRDITIDGSVVLDAVEALNYKAGF